MKTHYQLRYAAHPRDAKNYDTARLRDDFLIETLFVADEVHMVYSMYDRMIVGGAMPCQEELSLEAIDPLKADHFTSRREVGIYNVGEGEAIVTLLQQHHGAQGLSLPQGDQGGCRHRAHGFAGDEQ